MKVCTIRVSDTNEINIERGGMAAIEIVTALDAVINVLCEQATGDYLKGQEMKKTCANMNNQASGKIILPNG